MEPRRGSGRRQKHRRGVQQNKLTTNVQERERARSYPDIIKCHKAKREGENGGGAPRDEMGQDREGVMLGSWGLEGG